MKRILIGMTLLLSTVACQKGEASKEASSQDPEGDAAPGVPVKVMKIEPASYREYGEYVGQVEAVKEAKLTSYTGGRVKSIKADRGDQVKKGDKLCSIEGEKFNTIYRSARLAEKLAKESLERNKKHVENGTSSRTLVDRAEMEYLQAKQARLEAQKPVRVLFVLRLSLGWWSIERSKPMTRPTQGKQPST